MSEISLPFGLDRNGSIAATSNIDVQAMQHVKSLVCTSPGERVMLPGYGIPLKTYEWQPGLSAVTDQISNDVTRQMAAWEPNINVRDVLPMPDENNGIASLEVDFNSLVTSPASTPPIHTATVHVGGLVTGS